MAQPSSGALLAERGDAVLDAGVRAQLGTADGFSPGETATFVFSLKQPLSDVLGQVLGPEELAGAPWDASIVIDGLALLTLASDQHIRERVIRRQQEQWLEQSTVVIRLGRAVAVPLIGTLDSEKIVSDMPGGA